MKKESFTIRTQFQNNKRVRNTKIRLRFEELVKQGIPKMVIYDLIKDEFGVYSIITIRKILKTNE